MNLQIRPLNMDDFHYVVKWSKDDAFCSANDWAKNRDEEELYKWWQYCVNNLPTDFIRLGIDLDNQFIGYADLACIKRNAAELGIAIGESSLWGKGIGCNASTLMMEYALAHYGITVFDAETHETNHRARKMLKRIGFNEVSRIGSEEYLGAETGLIQYRLHYGGASLNSQR